MENQRLEKCVWNFRGFRSFLWSPVLVISKRNHWNNLCLSLAQRSYIVSLIMHVPHILTVVVWVCRVFYPVACFVAFRLSWVNCIRWGWYRQTLRLQREEAAQEKFMKEKHRKSPFPSRQWATAWGCKDGQAAFSKASLSKAQMTHARQLRLSHRKST